MWITGAGYAVPQGRVSNQLLEELRPDYLSSGLLTALGIVNRATVLPESYIRDTGNEVVRLAPQAAAGNAVTLAVPAVEMALTRAGIQPEDVGLLIADGITPPETTPALAAQIGMQFHIKVPVYDIVLGGGGLPHLIASLCSWKQDRVPTHVLVVSTNALTTRVNYRTGSAAAFLGDGACALVLSPEISTGIEIQQCWSQPGSSAGLTITGSDPVAFDAELLRREQGGRARMVLDRLLPEVSGDVTGLHVVLGCADPKMELEVARQFNLSPESVVTGTAEIGYSGSSSVGIVLARQWDHYVGQRQMLVADSGCGALFGGLLCRGMA